MTVPKGIKWYLHPAHCEAVEIADKHARDSSIQKFVGPEPSLQISRQNIGRKIKCWMDNQHLARW